MSISLDKPSNNTSQPSFPFFEQQVNSTFNQSDVISYPFPLNITKLFSKKPQLPTVMAKHPIFSMIQPPEKMFQFQKTLSLEKTQSKIILDNNNQVRIDEKNMSFTGHQSLEHFNESSRDIKCVDIQIIQVGKIDGNKKSFTQERNLCVKNSPLNNQNQNQKLPQVLQVRFDPALIEEIQRESKVIFDNKICPTIKSYQLISKISILLSTLLLIAKIVQIFFFTHKADSSLYLFCADMIIWNVGATIAIRYLQVFKIIPLLISLLLITISFIPQAFGYYYSISNNIGINTFAILDICFIAIETIQKCKNDINKNLQLSQLLRNHHNKFKDLSQSLLQSFL